VAALLGLSWFGGRRLLRLIEKSFWSLNALGIQPVYVVCREGLRQIAEGLLPQAASAAGRASVRAISAAASGVAISAASFWVAALAWPASRWVGSLAEFASPRLLMTIVLANAVVIIAGYGGAAFVWGMADATMGSRATCGPSDAPREAAGHGAWHLSDIHTVGERYGFRVESGRSGARGNERLRQALARLYGIHATQPLDAILISGDLTDAGVSAEWAEFFDALAPYPALAELLIGLPGNHDVNVVDRANPARLDLPTSPTKRLRQLRSAPRSPRCRVPAPGLRSLPGRLGDTLA
jgi:hypothetical protein